MKKKILFLLFTFMVGNLYSMEITLQEAIRKGVSENVNVKNEKITQENTEIMKKQAIKTALPKVKLTSSYTKFENPMNPMDKNSDNMYGNKISIEQPIFTGGKILIGIDTADLLGKQGNYLLEKKEKDAELEITKSYITILKLEKNREVLKDSLEQLKETYKMINAQYKLNLITKTPLLEIDYTMTNLDSQLLELEKGIKISKANLKRLIGMANSETIELKDISIKENQEKILNIDEGIKIAKENGTDVKLVKIGTEFQEMNTKLKRADLFPTIAFNFGIENSSTDIEGIKDKWNWSGTIMFSYNLFDFGNSQDEYRKSKNELKISKNSEKNSLEQLEIGIRNSYYELEISKKLIKAKEQALASSKEQYELDKGRHIAGLITTTDFLKSENNLRQSEINLINARLDYYLAEKTYENKIK
ncbi:TolC family protein [Haliovirga abyssi]|uniref:Membrane protein n=1 Tax=Haliovirga abyssi TaxID=2996794 RepID=A0AAU9DCP6_9FUSO|nr:TolC family protein [Haliovirga abyssi]BDU49928.1 membrane protein [Haliovirga abyssi]